MHNLLKTEFYKLARTRSFWGLLIFSITLGSILLLDNALPVAASGCFYSSLYNTPLLYFIPIIFGGLFIGEDFNSRTLYTYVSAGHRRGTTLCAKAVSYLTACICLLTAPLLFDSLIGIIFLGYQDGFTCRAAEELVILTAICAMAMLPFLCAFLFKDIGKTTAVPMALYFLMLFLLNGNNSKILAVFLPIGQLRLISLHQSSAACLWMTAVDLGWIILCGAGAWAAFHRCDLT